MAGGISDNMKNPLIIAHRGASYYAPENTLASAKLAWEQDADALEADVHKSSDNNIVVIHDPDTLRTTGVMKIIRDEKLSDIQKLDAGSWKDPRYRGEFIPSLMEILQTVPHNKKMCVEIKSADCINLIEKLIKKSHLQAEQLVFMDFDINTVIKAKKVFRQSEILWLYEFIPPLREENARDTFDMIIEKAQSVEADGINIEFNPFINRDLIKEVHDLGMKFYSWTINDITDAKNLMDWGVDGITTDRPGWLKENLKMQQL
jgi:glycerophosphoryl diester phosphodiesterase